MAYLINTQLQLGVSSLDICFREPSVRRAMFIETVGVAVMPSARRAMSFVEG
jgi:hypothetical protein